MQGNFQTHQIIVAARICLNQAQASRRHRLGCLKFQQIVHLSAKFQHVFDKQGRLGSCRRRVLETDLAGDHRSYQRHALR